jgi:hypothetical protein
MTKEQFLDIKTNKKYRHQRGESINAILGNSGFYQRSKICFYSDSMIYFGNDLNRMDSLLLSGVPVEETDEPAYFANTFYSQWDLPIVFSALGILLMALFILYVIKRRHTKLKVYIQTENEGKENAAQVNPMEQMKLRSGKLTELLNLQQVDFLQKLFVNSMNNRMTTIEELNRILGTQSKNVEIQKKIRSDMINGINERFSFSLGIETSIIDKHRSEFDRRSFEYFISPAHMELIASVLPQESGTEISGSADPSLRP